LTENEFTLNFHALTSQVKSELPWLFRRGVFPIPAKVCVEATMPSSHSKFSTARIAINQLSGTVCALPAVFTKAVKSYP